MRRGGSFLNYPSFQTRTEHSEVSDLEPRFLYAEVAGFQITRSASLHASLE
jgi:hypothetical protein